MLKIKTGFILIISLSQISAKAQILDNVLKAAQDNVSTVFSFNRFTFRHVSGEVIVTGGMGRVCESEGTNCTRADFLFHKTKDPKTYKPGEYIFDELYLTLDEENRLNTTIRSCVVRQAQEVEKLNTLLPGAENIFKILDIAYPNDIQVYDRNRLHPNLEKSYLENADLNFKIYWGPFDAPILSGENVMVIKASLAVNIGEADPCSLVSAQEIKQKVTSIRYIIGQPSLLK